MSSCSNFLVNSGSSPLNLMTNLYHQFSGLMQVNLEEASRIATKNLLNLLVGHI